MADIEAATIVSGAYDSSGHLILTKHDGGQVDAGLLTASTTTQRGSVELATDAETQAGTDAARAVTPASLASIPGNKVQILGTVPAETATPASYPLGISHMQLTGSESWSINTSVGSVVTNRPHTDRTQQTFYSNPGGIGNPRAWMRYYHTSNNGGGWTAWRQVMIMNDLTAASYTQTTALSSYPTGISRIYFTTSSSAGWDFAGIAGEIVTYVDGTDFARQDFTSHVGGSSAKPVRWVRTANSASSWTPWQKLFVDPGAYLYYTPTWSTTSGLHLPSFGNASVDVKAYKIGKKVDVQFDVTFGSTTNFGATPATTDNWTFGLPPAWPGNTTQPITFLGLGDVYRNATNLGVIRIKMTGSTSVSFNIGLCFVGTSTLSGSIGGDVDSITPWTWASGDAIRGTFSYETTA
jgi:hypothetical protein